MARILITNGGKHSSEKWAMVTAEMIFPLDDTALVGERLIGAQKFQTQLAELISDHHAAVMSHEADRLQADAEHFASPLTSESHLDDVMEGIQAAAKDGPWAEHFAKPEVIKIIREIVDNHINSIKHGERTWHAAHNASEHGDRYLALFGL